MTIMIRLDLLLVQRKMKANELAKLIGITQQNLSVLKNGKAKAIRLSTLEKLCHHLQCQPGDLLVYEDSESKNKEV